MVEVAAGHRPCTGMCVCESVMSVSEWAGVCLVAIRGKCAACRSMQSQEHLEGVPQSRSVSRLSLVRRHCMQALRHSAVQQAAAAGLPAHL